MPYTLEGTLLDQTRPFTISGATYPPSTFTTLSRTELERLGLVWVEVPVAARTLDELVEMVNAARDSRQALPFSFDFEDTPALQSNGTSIPAGIRQLQADPTSRGVLAVIHQRALAAVDGGEPNKPMLVRTADNMNLQVPAEQFLQCFEDLSARNERIMLYGAQVKTTIRAATTDAGRQAAYNAGVNWPS